MSLIKNNALVGASGQGGYFIDRSLRFRSSASAYLSRTPASAGNRKTWTWSGWVKRGALSSNQRIFEGFSDSSNFASIVFGSSDSLQIVFLSGGSAVYNLITTQVFRDVSSWYHICVSVDTTQATSSNRIKVYINGEQVTAFGTATYGSQNFDTQTNNTVSHAIGRYLGGSFYLDGYLTEINFIDGQALDPTYFGEYNATTGVWQPKKYGGAYGTNGFYLNFSDNTSTTTLGYDTSGQGNNWTANNISVTAGATYDSMTDVPTLTSEDAANYCTLSPLDYVTAAPTSGNLKLTNGFARATMAIPSTGKWYWENTIGASSNNSCGLSPASSSVSDANGGSGFYAYHISGNKYTAGSSSAYGASWTNGDVISVAVDADAGTVTFYKNNVSQGVAFTGLDFSSPWLPLARPITSATTDINFGQRPFAYTPPAGFKSLNTYNLTDSTIEDGSKYFDVVLRTGTGTADGQSQIISSLAFTPDLVWNKARSLAFNHNLVDSVRGNDALLLSNSTNAETSVGTTGTQLQITANGFTAIQRVSYNATNQNGVTYVAWNWKESATAGFDIVTFTNTASSASFNHSLGVTPSMIILKGRGPTAANWTVFHKSLANMTSAFLGLNTTNGVGTLGTAVPAPTSTTFGSSSAAIPASESSVAYLFADVEGYSKFGSYTGNGSTTGDGPFVYLGFRPAFVLIKISSGTTGSWYIFDSARNTYNVVNTGLFPDLPNDEISSVNYNMDFLSNGFKIKTSQPSQNGSTYTYIYAAFAENPFKNALAR